MAWIKVIDEHEARGYVKEVYQQGHNPFGSVDEILTVFSLRPNFMEARRAFGSTMTFGGSGLGRYKEELIAVSISAILRCKY